MRYLHREVLWSDEFVCLTVRWFINLVVISQTLQVKYSWNFAQALMQHLWQISLNVWGVKVKVQGQTRREL